MSISSLIVVGIQHHCHLYHLFHHPLHKPLVWRFVFVVVPSRRPVKKGKYRSVLNVVYREGLNSGDVSTGHDLVVGENLLELSSLGRIDRFREDNLRAGQKRKAKETYIEGNVKITKRLGSVFNGKTLVRDSHGVSGRNDVVAIVGDTDFSVIQMSQDELKSSESFDQLNW